jgi:hypothetical protein
VLPPVVNECDVCNVVKLAACSCSGRSFISLRVPRYIRHGSYHLDRNLASTDYLSPRANEQASWLLYNLSRSFSSDLVASLV